MLERFKHLIDDPLPLLLFEISEQAVAAVRRNHRTLQAEARAFQPLPPGVVEASPGKQNVHNPEALALAVESLLEELGPARRADAALIVPDGCSRMTLLEFDKLPLDPKERLALIRFRVKKTVPFDVEFAQIAYQPQKTVAGLTLLVAVTPTEVVKQYEAPLRAAGLQPGFVSPSAAMALNLMPDGEMTLFVKTAKRTLTMAVLEGPTVRLLRSVDMAPREDLSSREMLADMVADLYPTFVFIEDNLGASVSKMVICGFDELLEPALEFLPAELGCTVEPLRSPAGIVTGREAGILGYMSVH